MISKLKLLLAPATLRATGLPLGLGLAVFAVPAHAQLAIVDVDTYANAIKTLKIIDQQVLQLQNEAQMLLRMDKHLTRIDFPQLDALVEKLNRIDQLMGQAQGVNFRVDQLEDKLRQLYPREFEAALKRDQRVQAARARLDASNDAFRRTMAVQSQLVDDIQEDAQALSAAIARSQGAEGSLAASQATNQLLAITAKQQLQLQQMLAAQFRSDTLEKQRQLTQGEEARAAAKRFLGTGKAYTPQQ